MPSLAFIFAWVVSAAPRQAFDVLLAAKGRTLLITPIADQAWLSPSRELLSRNAKYVRMHALHLLVDGAISGQRGGCVSKAHRPLGKLKCHRACWRAVALLRGYLEICSWWGVSSMRSYRLAWTIVSAMLTLSRYKAFPFSLCCTIYEDDRATFSYNAFALNVI